MPEFPNVRGSPAASKPDTPRRSSFGRNLLSSLGSSLRGNHHDDAILSNSATIGNLAKFTDDHVDSRANGNLQDISNSDDDEDDSNLYEDAQVLNLVASRNDEYSGNVIPDADTQSAPADVETAPIVFNGINNTDTIDVTPPVLPHFPRNKPENTSATELSRRDTIIGNVLDQPVSSSSENDNPRQLASNLLFQLPPLEFSPDVDNMQTITHSQFHNHSQFQSHLHSDHLHLQHPHLEHQPHSGHSEHQHTQSDLDRTNIGDTHQVDESFNGLDKDGFYSIRLTPMIDHSSTSTGLYFSPIIRKFKPTFSVSIGRYTEKNKAAAHAPQGSSAPIVFKSKVVSRTHALLQCNEIGQWFLKDCKSSSGTFLNSIRLSPASQESSLMPLVDGDVIQLGMDYRGGAEEVYRCVKIRCEFNKSWQRKVNQFNLEIHNKLKTLQITDNEEVVSKDRSPLQSGLSECAICLMKIDPCQAIFMSPCSHAWHYKCIRPIIIKSYPLFYCPNCRTMCDLETDLDDD